MWHLTLYMWHVTCDTWHVTHDTWHVSPLYLLWFGCIYVLKVWSKRVTQLMNCNGICRTAPATPGLVITCLMNVSFSAQPIRLHCGHNRVTTQSNPARQQYILLCPMSPPAQSTSSSTVPLGRSSRSKSAGKVTSRSWSDEAYSCHCCNWNISSFG